MNQELSDQDKQKDLLRFQTAPGDHAPGWLWKEWLDNAEQTPAVQRLKAILFEGDQVPSYFGVTTGHSMEAFAKSFNGQPMVQKKPSFQEIVEELVQIMDVESWATLASVIDAKPLNNAEWNEMILFLRPFEAEIGKARREKREPTIPGVVVQMVKYMTRVMSMLEETEWTLNRHRSWTRPLAY